MRRRAMERAVVSDDPAEPTVRLTVYRDQERLPVDLDPMRRFCSRASCSTQRCAVCRCMPEVSYD